MKKLTYLAVIFFSFSFALQAKVTTQKTTVFFNTDKHQLTTESVNQLADFIHQHLKTNDYEIKIEGHTDNIGDISYNQNLSQNRAEEVKQFLVDLGVNQKLVDIEYKGELDPDKPNVNEIFRRKNRRVEVTLISYEFDNISELEEALNPNKTTNHIIKPNQENLIVGNKGVKILIQPETFTYEDGTSVTEDINFELTESLQFKDFISSGLLTKTSDDILETGGMIKVDATTVSGKPVKVKEDNPMLIAIPNENVQENMEVFTSDAGAEWQAKNQPINKVSLMKFKAEPYPVFKDVNIKLPKYHADKSTQPEQPKYPYHPRMPKEPREDSYIRPIAWYRFKKDDIREFQRKSYLAAMDKYYNRMEKYDEKLASYKVNLMNYKSAYKDYKCKMEAWHANAEYERIQFKRTDNYQKLLAQRNEIYADNLKKFKKRLDEWRNRRKANMTAMGQKMDKMGLADEQALNNYVFTFNQLKWINVDRFYHLKEDQKQLITMKGDDMGNERVLILFKNIESMLPMYLDKTTEDYRQYNFPIGEEAVIFAYKVEDGKPMLCYREISDAEDYELDFIETSFFEIKEILNQFDGPKKS